MLMMTWEPCQYEVIESEKKPDGNENGRAKWMNLSYYYYYASDDDDDYEVDADYDYDYNDNDYNDDGPNGGTWVTQNHYIDYNDWMMTYLIKLKQCSLLHHDKSKDDLYTEPNSYQCLGQTFLMYLTKNC